MKRTLLQVTQEYLDATSGFYVDSIFDTDESQQVAKVAERVYYQMVQEYDNLLFTTEELNLVSVTDTAKPNYMLLPENVQKVQESKVWYNTSTTDGVLSYKLLQYLPPLDFIAHTLHSNSDNSIIVEGYNNTKMPIKKNQFPSYFTSFDDVYVVFDSYHEDYDTVLQASKTRFVGSQEKVFLQEDSFEIPIPTHLSETYLDMFLNEALTLIHQQPIAMISQRARAKKIKLQQASRTLGSSRSKTKYGRKGASSSYTPRGHGE